MKTKTIMLVMLLISAFAVSQGVFAERDGSRGTRGERADGGERNRDKSLKEAEKASASGRGKGTPIEEVEEGEPEDPDHTFNSTKEETMQHR